MWWWWRGWGEVWVGVWADDGSVSYIVRQRAWPSVREGGRTASRPQSRCSLHVPPQSASRSIPVQPSPVPRHRHRRSSSSPSPSSVARAHLHAYIGHRAYVPKGVPCACPSIIAFIAPSTHVLTAGVHIGPSPRTSRRSHVQESLIAPETRYGLAARPCSGNVLTQTVQYKYCPYCALRVHLSPTLFCTSAQIRIIYSIDTPMSLHLPCGLKSPWFLRWRVMSLLAARTRLRYRPSRGVPRETVAYHMATLANGECSFTALTESTPLVDPGNERGRS